MIGSEFLLAQVEVVSKGRINEKGCLLLLCVRVLFQVATQSGRGGVTLVDPDARLGLRFGIDVSHSNPL